MKLVRYGPRGKEKPGLIDADGKLRDLSKIVADIDADTLSPKGLAAIRKRDPRRLPLVKGNPRLGPPVVERRTFAIALNYREHAAEANAQIPSEPLVFTKTCPLTGHRDNIVIPKGAKKTDWEVELCMVIGRKASHVTKKDALKYVAGYFAGNDVSEREFLIERGGLQWIKGKSPDTFGPIGPWLLTADEVANPNSLHMWLEVNGVRKQDNNTRDMIYDCKTLVSNLSQTITLYPGDIIFTGTPQGVGYGEKNPKYLRPGDVVTMGIEGLGEHRNKCVAFK
jgi:2-keto-4-pentenoate hydratase/2-oxohepta-3-ene-1,7-dioic acid hydratase in catechol pathway